MPATLPEKPTIRHSHLLELALTVFLWHAALGVFFLSLVQQYLPDELGASAAFPGYALAIYSLARFLWQTPAGWLADRFGRRITLALGIATAIPTLTLMMQVREGHLFLVFSALYGLGAATMWPALMAHVADTHEPSVRGRTLHFLNLAQLLGLGAGVVLGVVLVDYISYEAAFLACLAFSGLALALAMRRIEEPASRARERGARTQQPGIRGLRLAITPGVLFLAAIVLFLSLGTTIHTPVIGTYASEVLRTELHRLAFMLFIPASVAAVVAVRCSHLADRFGRQLPLMVGLAVAALSLFALTLTRSPFLAMNLVVLAGLAYAVSIPAWSAAAMDATEIGSRGVLLGALAAVQGLGGAMGQALGGAVNQLYGPLAPFKFGAMLLAVALVLTFVHLRHQRKRRPLHTHPVPPAAFA
jgi:DHA1 family multidrug resistance protein-like MFS transporter